MSETPLAAVLAGMPPEENVFGLRTGLPDDTAGWELCSAVTRARFARWEDDAARYMRREFGGTHPLATSGHTLGWYASIAGYVGGTFFRRARRVPRLSADVLAFRFAEEGPWPDAIALLDDRFWCLPDDPAAGHPAAGPVADAGALAALLRGQVAAFREETLGRVRPSARLPRRTLRGVFTDGLDIGLWLGGPSSVADAPQILRDAALVLPGGAPEMLEPTSVYVLTDGRGRRHLSRRRIGCCYSYRLPGDDILACATCPRVDDEERAARHTAYDT
ncbi:MAG: (2Fe-2S)-binding protein [Pseudonocardia sp.]